MTDEITPPFAIWQGFRHSWTYNHRLNRLGDWLDTKSRDGDMVKVELGHSAASGSGKDEASFRSFHSVVRARGVHYREFKRTIVITSREQESQTFLREIRVASGDGIPADCDSFAAVLCGFDLWSEKDSDKLISFHLATTVPERDRRTGEIVFGLVGALNVDCDSPECDNYETTGGMVAAIASGAWVGANYGGAPGAIIGGIVGGVFGDLFAKLNITTDYTLEVRCALIAARAADFHANLQIEENDYRWNAENVITRAGKGTFRRVIRGDDDRRWRQSVPAITQLSLEVTREQGFLRPDTAMHLLEWDMAVLPERVDGRSCTADVELFFRNWRSQPSEHLDGKIDPPIIRDVDWLDDGIEGIFSHRDAGSASIVLGLALLQFADAEAVIADPWDGSLIWEGRGASANSPDAVRTRRRSHVIDMPEAEAPPAMDMNHWIAADHCI